MLSLQDAEARCAAAIDLALKAGADAADAVAIGSASEEVQIRLGKLEDVARSESEDISLRVFCGQRSASIHATDMSDAALAELAERAVAMAKAAPEDQYAGLAPAELLAKGPFPDLELEDAGVRWRIFAYGRLGRVAQLGVFDPGDEMVHAPTVYRFGGGGGLSNNSSSFYSINLSECANN